MKVAIVQSQIKQYRVPFYQVLQRRLSTDNIELRIIYSMPNAQEAMKCDNVDIDCDLGIKVPVTWLVGNRLVYQHAWRQLHDADLVIVEQASKHLINYLLFASRKIYSRKIAFWGHGYNRQGDGAKLGEFVKHRMLRLPDWWFGYTAGSVRFLIEHGVPAKITTNVQNAIDTTQLARATETVTIGQADALRNSLKISTNSRVGLFCGSLYSHKQLSLLIQSSVIIRSNISNYHLIILGEGPDKDIITAAASRYSWIHYAGAKFGNDRAQYFKISEIILNPGAVGLALLDAFAAGVPLFTSDTHLHGPEIEYLVDGYNGVIAKNGVRQFADAVIAALMNQRLLTTLKKGAYESGRKYTIEKMADNFASGIKNCLA